MLGAMMLESVIEPHRGVFQPSELALFERVLGRLNSKALSEAEREGIAQRVLGNYMAGLRDEDELVESSRRPLRR